MAIGGHQVGPVSQEDVVTNLRNGTIDGNTLVFSAGMANWTPLKDVPELASYLPGAAASRPRGGAATDRPASARTRSTSASSAARCSSSRSSSIPARAPWPKPAR